MFRLQKNEMSKRLHMCLPSTKRQNRLTQLLIPYKLKSLMENEDNLPVQCHPIIKPKKRIKSDKD